MSAVECLENVALTDGEFICLLDTNRLTGEK